MPRALQKYFCDKEGRIWFAKRESLNGAFSEAEPRSPNSAFQARNFYTVLGPDDRPSDEVEREFYGTVDDQVGKTISEVTPILERKQAPLFSGVALDSFKNLVLALHLRTIDITRKHDEEAIGSEIIRGTISEAAKKFGVNEEDVRSAQKFPDPMILGRSVRVRAQTVRPDLSLDALKKYSVSAVSAEKKSSFILGSRIVYRISNGTADTLGSKNVEIWFPITPKHCLVLHALEREFNQPIVWPRDRIRQINEHIVDSCLEVGSHSEDLLRSLLR